MGYYVNIICENNLAEFEGITLAEWHNYIDRDPELQRPPENVPNAKFLALLRSVANNPERWPCLYWTNGRISTKYPDRRTVLKMIEIARYFGGNVVGEESERYTTNEEGRLFVEDSEWKAETIEDPSSVTHNSRWAALWELELLPITAKVDEPQFVALLVKCFTMSTETATNIIDHLQNWCRVILGTQLESTAVDFSKGCAELNVQCNVKEFANNSPERYPIHLAPDDVFGPTNLVVTGCSNSIDKNLAIDQLSEHLQISILDAEMVMEKLKEGIPTPFAYRTLLAAAVAREALQSYGFTFRLT
jgi:hypothetical protein